jgi:hypothetical protein
MRNARAALRNMRKNSARVEYISDPQTPGPHGRRLWRLRAESYGQIERRDMRPPRVEIFHQ